MSFLIQNAVDQAYVDAHTGDGINAISDATVASADPLDLSGYTSCQLDVTGIVGTDTIIIDEGVDIVLRFLSAGLILTPSASLILPGGKEFTSTVNSWGAFRGGAGSVTTCLILTNEDGYSTQTLENVYFTPGANLGFQDTGSPYFDIGHSSVISLGSFIRIEDGGDPSLIRHDLSAGASLMTDLINSTRSFQFPDQDGTFAMLSDIVVSMSTADNETKARLNMAISE